MAFRWRPICTRVAQESNDTVYRIRYIGKSHLADTEPVSAGRLAGC
jgi:hypothetical protein